MAMAARKAPPACSAPSPTMMASATKAGADSTSPPKSHRAVEFMAACSLAFSPRPGGRGGAAPVLLDRLMSGQRGEIDEIGHRGAHLDDLRRLLEPHQQ